MTTISPDTVRRINDAATAQIAAGNLNPANEQVRLLWQAAVNFKLNCWP
ncbi:TPA: hypothetical protein I3806_005005 [Enterobacter cloacae]|nr:hypothetical protein [Enterobacter cloacae]